MAVNTQMPNTHEAPPTFEVGALGWIKKNLFGSKLDAFLTFVSLALLAVVLVPSIRWTIGKANWGSVTGNIFILMHGPLYPIGNLACLFILCLALYSRSH